MGEASPSQAGVATGPWSHTGSPDQHDRPHPRVLPRPSWPCPSPGAWHPQLTAALPAWSAPQPARCCSGQEREVWPARAGCPAPRGHWVTEAGWVLPSGTPPLLLAGDRGPRHLPSAPATGSRGPGFSQEGWGAQNERPQRVWGASELLGLQMGEAPGGGGATGRTLGLRRHPGDWQRVLSAPPRPFLGGTVVLLFSSEGTHPASDRYQGAGFGLGGVVSNSPGKDTCSLLTRFSLWATGIRKPTGRGWGVGVSLK